MSRCNFNKKNSSFILILFAVLFSICCFFAPYAHGDNQEDFNMKTKSFNVDINISENFIYDVHERITVDFLNQRQGIFRYIPTNRGLYHIDSISVANDNFEVSSKFSDWPVNELSMVRIGTEGLYIQGAKTYELSYKLIGIENRKNGSNSILLNIIPPNWKTPIASAIITIKLPKPVSAQPKFFLGNSKSPTQDSRVTYSLSNNTLVVQAKNLSSHEGITMDLPLPSNYWVNPRSFSLVESILILSMASASIGSIVLYILCSRKKLYPETVEFYPPNGITPAEAGYIVDSTLDSRDLTSMLIYFASKGYIKIEEVNAGAYHFHKIKDMGIDEESYTQYMFNAIFADGQFKTDEPSPVFAETIKETSAILRDKYLGKIFTLSSRFLSIILGILQTGITAFTLYYAVLMSTDHKMTVFAYIAMALSVISPIAFKIYKNKQEVLSSSRKTISLFAILSTSICSIAIIGYIFLRGFSSTSVAIFVYIAFYFILCFTRVNIRKSDDSVEMLRARIKGFKNFILVSEADRLNTLVYENPNYFFDILPYAYVFGISDKWISQFESLNISLNSPSWYEGYDNLPPNYLIFSNILYSANSAYQTSITQQLEDISNSSGSSFGGGSFGGGGFGGGGGGSW